MEAFVYCWTDHKNNMLYVGSHKGTPDDRYVCSSKYMLDQYKVRQQDFTKNAASIAGKASAQKRKESGYYQSEEAKLRYAKMWQIRRARKEGLVNGN